MNDISLTPKGDAYAARQGLHLPAETAMALAMALSDPDVDVPHQRSAVETAIDDLIAFLDDTDGDPDLEPSLCGADDDREGGDVLDEPHDEIDQDGRDVSWPERGPHVVSGAWATEDDEDNADDEPSLGSLNGSGLGVAAMGFLRIKPYHFTDEDFARSESLYRDPRPVRGAHSQTSWSLGSSSDKEDEHDGAEPDNEHGPSWAEELASGGVLLSGSDEDHEPSLGTPEQFDQITRMVQDKTVWGLTDGELTDEDGGDILDEPHDDNENDGDEARDGWPSVGSEMTDEQKVVAASEGRRLLKQARKVASA